MPCGKIAPAYILFRENIPGSQPTEIIATFPPAVALASTFAKCSGMFAWVSKLSITLNSSAYFDVCTGKSVALPPQRIITSIFPCHFSTSSIWQTATPSERTLTLSGFLLVNTATNSMSGFCLMAHSTPRPKLPYPNIPILILIILLLLQQANSFSAFTARTLLSLIITQTYTFYHIKLIKPHIFCKLIPRSLALLPGLCHPKTYR